MRLHVDNQDARNTRLPIDPLHHVSQPVRIP